MSICSSDLFRCLTVLFLALVLALGGTSVADAQLNVLSVDCTPLVSPGGSPFGSTNTMGMSLQQVDTGGLFNVTEVTPAAYRALTAGQLATYDLIAVNNNPARLSDNCDGLPPGGLGTTWHSVIGIQSGGRVVLNSHDAARFKIIISPGSAFSGQGTPGPGEEPFGADELVRQAALWAGGGSSTGLLIFNDSARFPTVLGVGWDNPELNLPAAWGISDLNQTNGIIHDGGYTDILAAFHLHPIYAGLTDDRFSVDSLSSFAAMAGDGSFHSVFATFNPSIFTPTEVVINAGVVDVGGYNAASQQPGAFPANIGVNNTIPGPDGSAIALIRDENLPPGCSGAFADPGKLWSPNHKFVPIEIAGLSDPEGGLLSVAVSAIFQDEPLNGVGDGNTSPDGKGVGTDTAMVRAERTGSKKVPGDGRVYHIFFTAADGLGSECEGSVQVCVPHDKRHGGTCVDQGPLYDSTTSP